MYTYVENKCIGSAPELSRSRFLPSLLCAEEWFLDTIPSTLIILVKRLVSPCQDKSLRMRLILFIDDKNGVKKKSLQGYQSNTIENWKRYNFIEFNDDVIEMKEQEFWFLCLFLTKTLRIRYIFPCLSKFASKIDLVKILPVSTSELIFVF